jgi:predicted DNA binding CopG/RHH family protein
MKNTKKENERVREMDEWGPGKRLDKPGRLQTKEEGEAILEKGGMQLITIRLPLEVIEKLKEMAEKDGIKYQPYIRKTLIQHTRTEVNSSLESRISKIENAVARLERKESA